MSRGTAAPAAPRTQRPWWSAVAIASATASRLLAQVAVRVVRRLQRPPEPPGAPPTRPSPLLAAHALFDEISIAVFKTRSNRVVDTDLDRVVDELREAVAHFEASGWMSDPLAYHRQPDPPARVWVERARLGPIVFEHLRFASEWEPQAGEPGRDRWLTYRTNAIAHAYVLRHDGRPRPWLVALNGVGTGIPLTDLFAFRAWRLYRAGLNVAMLVPPLHGPRRHAGVEYPGLDLVDLAHGLAQGVWDTRRVVAWARAEQGAPAVAIAGLSLGSCVAAVTAAVEPDLDCVIAAIPVADFALLYESHSTSNVRRMERFPEMVTEGRRLCRVVSPLALPPPRARSREVVASTMDGLADPIGQATALWEHWDRPPARWLSGGHTGVVLDGSAPRAVGDALRRAGLMTA